MSKLNVKDEYLDTFVGSWRIPLSKCNQKQLNSIKETHGENWFKKTEKKKD